MHFAFLPCIGAGSFYFGDIQEVPWKDDSIQ